MTKTAQTIYIKPCTWAGRLQHYLGYQPSQPDAHPCNRLGSYFLVVDDLRSARAIAQSLSSNVVECPHYVGFVDPNKTLHYSESPHAVDGYTMFSYFSFRDGALNVGQCQSVKTEEVALTREALKRSGWTPGGYKYVDGKPVLVEGGACE
jgi:hypothetical protein